MTEFEIIVLPTRMKVKMTLAEWQTLLQRLRDNDASLTEIDLYRDRVGFGRIGYSGAIALAAALKSNSTLKILNVGLNQIGDDGLRALVDALKDNRTLTKLYIFGSNGVMDIKISDAGAEVLAMMLEVNYTLEILDLGMNEIGYLGTKALANALKKNRSLKELNLNANKIMGDAGAETLAVMLKTNHSLRVLNLG